MRIVKERCHSIDPDENRPEGVDTLLQLATVAATIPFLLAGYKSLK
jgi:hypothetical protein